MLSPWLGILLVLGTLLTVMCGLHLLARLHPMHAETSRKLMHISLGLSTLSFPWLFDAVWPVVVTCGAIIVALSALRYSQRLKSHFGGVIDKVERSSLGEIYFPIGVAIVWILSGGDPILYCVPLAVLTLADAVAALVGRQYGHWRYSTPEGGRKSAEGSVAFFTVSFFIIHVPLLLFTDTARPETLLIALILSLLVTVFEAVAWSGLDNLFIPVGGYFLLQALLGMKVGELSIHLGVIAAVAFLAMIRRGETTLDDSALLAAVLAGYFIWTLGGIQWFVLPLILFLRGRPLRTATQGGEAHFHHMHALLAVVGPGLIWLMLAETFGRPDLFFPFALTFAVHLAVFEVSKISWRSHRSTILVGLACGSRSWVMLFVPFVLVERASPSSLIEAAWALPIVVLAAIGFLWGQRQVLALPNDSTRWLSQTAWSGAGSLAGLSLLALL